MKSKNSCIKWTYVLELFPFSYNSFPPSVLEVLDLLLWATELGRLEDFISSIVSKFLKLNHKDGYLIKDKMDFITIYFKDTKQIKYLGNTNSSKWVSAILLMILAPKKLWRHKNLCLN